MTRWSISAHKTLKRCQRQYVFSYLLAHHNANDNIRKRAYQLKQLSNLPQWKGKLVHQGLEKFISDIISDGSFDPKTIIRKTKKLGQNQLEFSRRKKFENSNITKSSAGDSYLALRKHAEDKTYSAQEIENLFKGVENCFRYLSEQDQLLAKLRNANNLWSEVNTGFYLGDWYVTGRIDLVAKMRDGSQYLIDWKTSKKLTDNRRQMYSYALTLINQWDDVDPANLKLMEVNLSSNCISKYNLNKENVIEAENFIFQSIRKMAKIEKYISTSEPKESKLGCLDLANSPGTCALCNFREICRNYNSTEVDNNP